MRELLNGEATCTITDVIKYLQKLAETDGLECVIDTEKGDASIYVFAPIPTNE